MEYSTYILRQPVVSQNLTFMLRVYSHVKMLKGKSLSLATTKSLNFSRNHIIISLVCVQPDVCRTNGAPCLRLRKAHYYSNNITNNSAVTVRTRNVHGQLSHMYEGHP